MLNTERIQLTAHTLGAIGVLTEQKFTAIGDSVERAVEILARLDVTFEALLAKMQGDAMIRAKRQLTLAAAEAIKLAGAPVSEVASLGRLAHLANAINSRITAMRHVAGYVDMLAVNARLISAAMGESGADFVEFAVGMSRAAALARGSLEQIGDELTNVGRLLDAARSRVAAYAERHGAALRTIPERLAAAVSAIEVHDRLATDATAGVAARTADIHRRVGGMIVELQLGDVTHQRIEHMQHVAGTLLLLASPPFAASSEWRGLSPGGAAALLQSGCNLAATQLRDVADELDREAARVADGLSRLAADARDISRLAEQAYGGADRQQRSFVADLEVSLQETEALFEGLRAAREHTDGSIADVLAIAGRLTGNIHTLRELEADIRIMGLNTTLKCGRLGVPGRPLSAIAQELRDCGSRTASHAAAALTDLRQLASLAGTFGATRTELAGAAGGAFTHELLGAVELLGQTGRALSDALAGLDNDSTAACQLLLEAADAFSVRQDLGEVLRSADQTFSLIGAEQAHRTTIDTAAMDRLLARFTAVYTMAREREVHLRCVGTRGQEPSQAAAPDLADVLF
jgi:hypothetical protein